MKIQPIDIDCQTMVPARAEPLKPVLKSRLKRLFDRQFPSVLRISSVEKPSVGEAQNGTKDGVGAGTEFEPSSVCLAKMVQNYIEESNEKPFRGRHRCNCFNGNINDSSDDEFDVFGGGNFGESIINGSSVDASDILKSLIPCASVHERNLLADTAMIVDKNKNHKQKDDLRKIVADGLISLGYDSSICKSKWDKSPSHPAGEYEYIDVNIEGERLLIDIDFRSEFEIARSTGTYRAILQSLPYIFVGKSDRLGQIVSIVSEAAKQSLKKKGMHFPPWRRAEYMRAKWLSSFTRQNEIISNTKSKIDEDECVATESSDECGELELIFGEKTAQVGTDSSSPAKLSGDDDKVNIDPATWQPPAVKPKSVDRGARMVTGLASLLKEKP
ncbi:uncharacterized protein LOC110611894 [Manihot esculenta]|uniref:DUF506 domain-containing protein n=1 Tax=Manihot esculenta TaxID=3983 RepID=A0A2C9WAS8_MANES|nr:uncharacterized protein LOC110611894 [Manihot esculenta]OAY55665.1 hypothetical protein MANES_03G171000v8 [Manihot esculenta]